MYMQNLKVVTKQSVMRTTYKNKDKLITKVQVSESESGKQTSEKNESEVHKCGTVIGEERKEERKRRY